MIFLHTLGVLTVRVGVRKVLPTATRAFASLIFLSLERDRTVARADLQALLFPDQGARAAAHNLRQLLYRLRGLGAPVVAEDRGITVLAESVRDDFSALRRGGPFDAKTLKAAASGVMPGYAPTFSRPFSLWVEEQRTRIAQDLVRGLVARLAERRSAGRWRDLEPIATACLALDPLNEEATLALAESLALTGQKARAVHVLDTYIEDVGAYGRDLRIPAHVLRTRISEHVPDASYRRLGPGPFVGRDAEMAELWRHYQHAKRGEPRAVVIHGEPGIGKTRLATEFLRAAALDGATCLKVECAPHDVRRPLGVFVDLVPKLLEAPGGLGVAPEAIDELRALTRTSVFAIDRIEDIEAEAISQSMLRALCDLAEAVASELPLILVVDNSDWMDPASADVISAVFATDSPPPVLVILTARSKASSLIHGAFQDQTHWLRAGPLSSGASADLFGALSRLSGANATTSVVGHCVQMARGNALFLRALAADVAAAEGDAMDTSSLGRALTYRVRQLSDEALRTFVAAAILGKRVTPSGLMSVSGLSSQALVSCVHMLEALGFIGGDLNDFGSVHPLLSQVAISEIPIMTRRLMHAAAADVLSSSNAAATNVATLWDSAEHWVQAGDTAKAVELLCSCADHCLQIGQPTVGCELLNRASTLDLGSKRTAILERLIHSARLAGDYRLVREAISQYRAVAEVAPSTSPHDDCELFDLEAARLAGGSSLDFIPLYTKCLTSPGADAHHRLMAATNIVIANDLALQPDLATSAYDRTQDIQCSSPQLKADREKLDLLYHCFVGDPATALNIASSIWTRFGRSVPSWRDVPLLVNVGMTMFRCGGPPDAVAILKATFRAAERAGVQSYAVDVASMLAWMSWIVADLDGKAEWDALADRAFEGRQGQLDRISHYLSNKIEFALERNDCATARKWLGVARDRYGEISAPRIVMVTRAFELRMEQIEARTPLTQSRLAELQVDHARGKLCGLHDNFVEAYWHALDASDSRTKADAMLAEYLGVRRDRFPLSPALGAIVALGAKA
jgi:DNA-binding SARP family transcriptional activator